MGKDSFILFNRIKDDVDYLTNEEAGQIFKAILDYVVDGVVTEFKDRAMIMTYNKFKHEHDYNTEQYHKRVMQNRQNGAKGGRPASDKTEQNQDKATKTKRFSNKPKKADNENDNDNDNENGNGNDEENGNGNDEDVGEGVSGKTGITPPNIGNKIKYQDGVYLNNEDFNSLKANYPQTYINGIRQLNDEISSGKQYNIEKHYNALLQICDTLENGDNACGN